MLIRIAPLAETNCKNSCQGEGVEPGQAGPFTLLALVLGGVEQVEDALQVRRGDAAAGRLFETLQGRLTLFSVRPNHGQLLAPCVMVAGALLNAVV